jgi:signal peptidase I
VKRKTRQRLLKFWREWIKPIAVVVIALSTFRSAIADWNDVPTGSMRPTIVEGDRIFVNKIAYDLKIPFTNYRIAKWSDPKPGHVVICYSPADGTRLVKRVIAVPGDTVAMSQNRVFINGRPLDYSRTQNTSHTNENETHRPTEHVFRERIGPITHAIAVTPQVNSSARSFPPLTLGPDEYFVLGDNRDNSKDSRFFGHIQRNQIVGKVNTVVLSLDRSHYYIPRWDRFLSPIE